MYGRKRIVLMLFPTIGCQWNYTGLKAHTQRIDMSKMATRREDNRNKEQKKKTKNKKWEKTNYRTVLFHLFGMVIDQRFTFIVNVSVHAGTHFARLFRSEVNVCTDWAMQQWLGRTKIVAQRCFWMFRWPLHQASQCM